MTVLRSIWSAKPPWLQVRSALVSLIVVFFSHLALAMIPRVFPFLSLVAMLPIAGLVMAFTHALAGCLRRLLLLKASAPAMVISHILFIWVVHITVLCEAISSLVFAALNVEFVLLLIGLYRISHGDPGIVSIESNCDYSLEKIDNFEAALPNKCSSIFSRIRLCHVCKRSIKGFDHHCPAFGNCIGQNNHHLFMVLLIGFIATEASFTLCSYQYINISSGAHGARFEKNFPGNLVISTLLFSFLQVLWQVPFLSWHIYCICYNIKTEEWVNWSKYPEFQLIIQPNQASSFPITRFVNPYDRGISINVAEYLTKSGDFLL